MAVTLVTIGGAATSTTNPLPVASTIDAVNDYLAVYTANVTATQAINRNTLLGISSQPVGLTDTQTLTNKTFTSPTISSPTLSGTIAGTYIIGGSPTFPSSVTTLTGTQTLTNKTLTSPVINAPTITNATISADTVTGYTTSNNGTVYGVAVSGGQITNAAIANGTIGSTQIATNGISAANLATNAITLGYQQITTSVTATGAIAGLSVPVTIPSGGRRVKITVYTGQLFNSSATTTNVTIYSGATLGALTTQLQSGTLNATSDNADTTIPMTVIAVITPSAGSVFYTPSLTVGAGTPTFSASSSAPAFILVEMI